MTVIEFVRDPQVRLYRPKPDARVEAIYWNGDFATIPNEWKATGLLELDPYGVLLIRNPSQGPSRVRLGSPIVRGTADEYYAPPRAVFEARWEVDQ